MFFVFSAAITADPLEAGKTKFKAPTDSASRESLTLLPGWLVSVSSGRDEYFVPPR